MIDSGFSPGLAQRYSRVTMVSPGRVEKVCDWTSAWPGQTRGVTIAVTGG